MDRVASRASRPFWYSASNSLSRRLSGTMRSRSISSSRASLSALCRAARSMVAPRASHAASSSWHRSTCSILACRLKAWSICRACTPLRSSATTSPDLPSSSDRSSTSLAEMPPRPCARISSVSQAATTAWRTSSLAASSSRKAAASLMASVSSMPSVMAFSSARLSSPRSMVAIASRTLASASEVAPWRSRVALAWATRSDAARAPPPSRAASSAFCSATILVGSPG
mmetsp:Transcript_21948/g.49630  ORF Transcript_21948/g.49630 Transcript_21948/m.49630 type:complete len:228 (-) Transcript_21948:904-1587(-)